MAISLIKSTVVKNIPLGKFHRLVYKTDDPTFVFKTGQFVALKVGDPIFRSYSIASTLQKLPFWEMFVDITPGGPGTTYIKNLKEGDIVKTTKPVGIFTLENNTKNYALGATGCGIASIRPMVEELLVKRQGDIYLFWGLRFEKDIVEEEVLKGWQEKYPNFKYEIVLSKPENSWLGKTGHIVGPVIDLVKTLPAEETGVYLCGNTNFIISTRQSLEEINFPQNLVYFEKYY